MHSNPTVSLRPGGGGKGRLFGTFQESNIVLPARFTFDGKATDFKGSKLSSERIKYTREELYKLKEVFLDIPKEIKDAVSEIEAELVIPEELEWARSQPNLIQAQQPLPLAARFSEGDNRDWKNRSPAVEEKRKDQQFKEPVKNSGGDWRDKDQERDVPPKELVKSSGSDWRDKNQERDVQPKEIVKSSGSDWRDKNQERDVQPKEIAKSSGSDWRDKNQERDVQLKEIAKSSGSDWRDKNQERDVKFKETVKSSGSDWRDKDQERDVRVSQILRQQDLGVDAAKLPPAIIRASNPWTVQRSALSNKERVLRTVKGILNKLTPEKFDLLVEQLLKSGIDSADILKGVISLVFDKAVLEPTFCAMYAEMCVCLSKALQEFPSDEGDGKPITFRRILLNSCQEEFEGADKMRSEIRKLTKPEEEVERFEKEKLVKLRTLGNIKLIGELFKLKMIPEKIIHYCIHMLLGSDLNNPPAEENIEALCQFLATVGKQLEESSKSTNTVYTIDPYFSKLKVYSTSTCFASRIRFLIKDTIDLRANNWIPRREVIKAKTINEIHAEAEKTLGLRPGMAGLRSGRDPVSMMGVPGMRRVPGGMNPGGMMPGMPGAMMPGMPGAMMPGMPGAMMPGMPGAMMPGRPGAMMPGGMIPGMAGGMLPGTPGLLSMAGKLPGAPLMPSFIPGVDSDGWEYSMSRRNRSVKEGLIPSPNPLPSKTFAVPPTGAGLRTNSANMKLLPQGRALVGKSSALLGDYERPSIEPSRSSFGVVPVREKIVTPSPPVVKQTASPAPFLPNSLLKKKSESLLKEYLSVGDLHEALLCVQELKSPPAFYSQLVQLAVSMGLESQDRERELIHKLLGELHSRKIISEGDIKAGIMIVAEQLEDLALDIPMAPKHIGFFVGKVALAGMVELGLLLDIIQKTEDPLLKKLVYDAAIKVIRFDPNLEWVSSQEYKLQECEKLIMVALGS